MSEWLVGAWTILTGAGGTVALVLIIAIALGINALTLLFFGSAVVALERFARVAQRRSVILLCGLVWAGVLGAAILYAAGSEDLAGADLAARLRAGAFATARAALAILVYGGICRSGMRTSLAIMRTRTIGGLP